MDILGIKQNTVKNTVSLHIGSSAPDPGIRHASMLVVDHRTLANSSVHIDGRMISLTTPAAILFQTEQQGLAPDSSASAQVHVSESGIAQLRLSKGDGHPALYTLDSAAFTLQYGETVADFVATFAKGHTKEVPPPASSSSSSHASVSTANKLKARCVSSDVNLNAVAGASSKKAQAILQKLFAQIEDGDQHYKELATSLAAELGIGTNEFLDMVRSELTKDALMLPATLHNFCTEAAEILESMTASSSSVNQLVQPDSKDVDSIVTENLERVDLVSIKSDRTTLPESLSPQEQAILDGFLQTYANAAGDEADPEQNGSALADKLRRAAIDFAGVGCKDAGEARQLMRKILTHDRWVRTIAGGVAGGAGYTAAMTGFVNAVAPRLPGHWSPAQVGLTAGLCVGSIDTAVSSLVRAVAKNHLYSGGALVGIKRVKDVQPGLSRTIKVSAVASAVYTGIKNSLRILVPAIMPAPLRRQTVSMVDLGVDAGGSFFASGAAAYHSHEILNEKNEELNFLMQDDLGERLRKFTQENTFQSVAKMAADDAASLAKAALKAPISPSTYLVTAYIAALVTGLIHFNSLVSESHDGEVAPDEIGKAEAMQKATVSTVMMSGLAGGAAITGISASVFLDRYTDMLFDKAATYLAKMTGP